MEKIKQELSLLIKTIDELFPAENDLKGFLGISKELILDSLRESDALLITLKTYDNHFETIFFKRELSDLLEKIKKELEEKFEKIKPIQFNSILKEISKIKFLIREAYVAVSNSQPFRTEAEILTAKAELTLLASNIEELKKINTDLTILKDSIIQNINGAKNEINDFKNLTMSNITGIQNEIAAVKDSTILNINVIPNEVVAAKDATILNITGIQNEVTAVKDSTILNINGIPNEVIVVKDATIQHISRIQNEVNVIKDTTVQTINTMADGVKVIKESAEKIVTEFEIKQKTSIENEQKINDFLVKIEAHKLAIEAIEKNTTLWESDINKAKEAIVLNSKEYNSVSAKSKTLQEDIEVAYEKIFGKKDEEGKISKGYLQETEDLKVQIAAFLSEQEKKFLAQFNNIESLLPGATSIGLAEAYQQQKNSYNQPIRLWSWVFIGIIGGMIALSIILICKQFNTALTISETIISLLKDLPFFIPTIWLAVFASKQQSQYKRLQQEYAFKETNAKSFHGHKRQIEELAKQGGTDNDLLLQLIAQLVVITSQNPSASLDNKAHNDSPPIFTLVEKMFSSKKNVKESKSV